MASFFAAINREREAAAQRGLERELAQQRQTSALQEIEARKQADLAIQNNQRENYLRQVGGVQTIQDTVEMQRQQKMVNDVQAELIKNGMEPGEALLEARSQVRQMMTNPAVAQAMSSRSDIERIAGALPLQREIGGAEGEQKLTSAQAQSSLNNLNILTNKARMSTAPAAAAQTDVATNALKTAEALKATSAMPLLSAEVTTGQQANISGSQLESAKNQYFSNEVGQLDPGLAAEAQKNTARAVSAKGAITSALGGFEPAPLNLGDPYGPFMGRKSPLVTRVNEAVSRPLPFTSALPTPTGTTNGPIDVTGILEPLKNRKVR